MKQYRSGFSTTIMFSPSEKEVAGILVEMATKISQLDCGFRLPFTWGRKGTRSAIRVTPSSSPSPSPFTQTKPEASSSPATPLSFSPSESELDKHTLLRKNVSLKRKREHYLKTIEELTKANDLRRGEIKNVKCYLDQLKDFNLKLKARKQELSLAPNQDIHVPEQPKLQTHAAAHSPPLILDQTARPPHISDGCDGVARSQQVQQACGQPTTSFGMPSSSSSGIALGNINNNVGPFGIPDLNLLPVEEAMCCEALDVTVANKNLSRAIAAQARQKRIQICKVKNPIANSKLRYSCRS